jgi:hypothetical protein
MLIVSLGDLLGIPACRVVAAAGGTIALIDCSVRDIGGPE